MHNPFAPPETAPPIATTTQFIPDEELSVEYQLSEDDYISWYLYWCGQSKTIRRQRLTSYMFFAGIVIFSGSALFLAIREPVVRAAVVGGTVAGAGSLVVSAFQVPKKRLTRLYRAMLANRTKQEKFRPTRLTIRADALKTSTELVESRMSWKCVEEILEVDLHVYLVLDRGSGEAAIIPKAAFPTNEYLRRFVAAARSFQQAAAAAPHSSLR